jgi:hypothetical protein
LSGTSVSPKFRPKLRGDASKPPPHQDRTDDAIADPDAYPLIAVFGKDL